MVAVVEVVVVNVAESSLVDYMLSVQLTSVVIVAAAAHGRGIAVGLAKQVLEKVYLIVLNWLVPL